MKQTHGVLLDRYTQIIARIGMNVQTDDWVALAAPLEAAPFVRALSQVLYRMGAAYVDVAWQDELTERERLLHAAEKHLLLVPQHRVQRAHEHLDRRSVRLSIYAEDPLAYADVPPERIAAQRRAVGEAMRDVYTRMGEVNPRWLVVSYPVAAWAQRVFPDLSAEQAVAQLWETIFTLCRCRHEDPLAAWQAHIADLNYRANYLNARRYRSLHFHGGGTDLLIGLADSHRWEGANAVDAQGLSFVPNIPTEEVFTAPHRERITGVIASTRPYAYAGNLIEGATFRFEEGRVVNHDARRGLDLLTRLLDQDAGARSLGEVALVPHSSPVGQTGLLFYNVLYDENAACHIAFGRAYEISVEGGTGKTLPELKHLGLNESLIHEDFMVGSAELNVDGIHDDGRVEPLLRAGEWAF
jgi:aminopeptidase